MANKKGKEEKKHVSVVTDKSLKFFEKYINNPSPTGSEWEGQRLWLEYLKPYVDKTYIDNYGTAMGIINPDAPYKVVIEAHADEFSWFVHYFTKDRLTSVVHNCAS